MSTTISETESLIDLSVSIAGLCFPSCVYNASGPRCGSAEAMAKIAASASTGAVLTKSATLDPQTGNPMPRIHHQHREEGGISSSSSSSSSFASFNSEGLPNKGIDYYIAEETIRTVLASSNNKNGQTTKPYIASLSGKTLADNLEMLRRIFKSIRTLPSDSIYKISAVELNLACPNIAGKPIIAYDVDQVQDYLKQIQALYSKEQQQKPTIALPPLGVKLAPYLDMVLLQKIANVVSQYASLVRYVVTINTVGNTLLIDGVNAESPFLRPNDGLAGMSGPAVTPIALANVWKLRQSLPTQISIIGVGGIRTGQDVYNMILCGATACQVGTTHWIEGPACFDRIIAELKQIMKRKGISSISSVTFALKPWDANNRPIVTTSPKALVKTGGETNQNATTMAKTKAASDNNTLLIYQGISMVLAVLVAILIAERGHRWHPMVGG